MEFTNALILGLSIASFTFGVIIAYVLFKYGENKRIKNEEKDNNKFEKYALNKMTSLFKQKTSFNNLEDFFRLVTWIKRYEKESISEEMFKLSLNSIHQYFSTTKMFDLNWCLFITSYNSEKGWVDLLLNKRNEEPVLIKVHYYDIPLFITICSFHTGLDTAITSYLSTKIINKTKEEKMDEK